jgi:hypothetical protein
MRSWDHFQIPRPFSRAVFLSADPIYVNANATDEQTEAAEKEVQRALDALVVRGDSWWGGEPDK